MDLVLNHFYLYDNRRIIKKVSPIIDTKYPWHPVDGLAIMLNSDTNPINRHYNVHNGLGLRLWCLSPRYNLGTFKLLTLQALVDFLNNIKDFNLKLGNNKAFLKEALEFAVGKI